ncbi:MAG: putative DNA modification/repair radical SAM protein [Bacteroidales bacterium]|nr:putative DNA modification/repair radical SAM protein [Bacteroidales bacterium]NLM92848.1 putative DNA modification/repair radical SAM protein [Bacteroidales bacterium]
MKEQVLKKLQVLADAAKYDVSCSSSGSTRPAKDGALGNAARAGVCHSFTEDGRCISLLKILYTNYCIYDCAYCINRRSNDLPRAAFSVDELVDLTLNFYRRNYIEGLFLSSGVVVSPDHTMERLIAVARKLRNEHHFNGYIHMKAIPGASAELVAEAGLWADRLSVNIEIPSENNLRLLAPEKNFGSVLSPMNQIHQGIVVNKEERRKFRKAPRFVPAGQSTQLIVGASPESDFDILRLASGFYKQQQLKRVYYSGFVPVNLNDSRLPALLKPPLVRENRLYQADWLMRFYQFSFDEILDDNHSFLDPNFDPKLTWALRNPAFFPIDLNTASYEMILRVPGIGVRSAKLIVTNRRFGSITFTHLKRMGVALKRARYFILCRELPLQLKEVDPVYIRRKLSPSIQPKAVQLSLFEHA